jgi:hypothetical protein
LSNEKTKNSLSEKRGSIVKLIDKLASSIATDEAKSTASESFASLMLMFMIQQMQQQQQQSQQQMQLQLQLQQAIMQRDVEMQINGAEVQMKGQSEVMLRVLIDMKKRDKKKKKRKKKKKTRKRNAVTEAGGEKVGMGSRISNSSSLFNLVIVITTLLLAFGHFL